MNESVKAGKSKRDQLPYTGNPSYEAGHEKSLIQIKLSSVRTLVRAGPVTACRVTGSKQGRLYGVDSENRITSNWLCAYAVA